MEKQEMHSAAITSSAERLRLCMDSIERWNPLVNAMITVDGEGARQSAEDADRASEMGRSRGLLHGIPVIVKDNIDTAGLRTTYGSGFFKDHIPANDATVVRLLRKAGAVIVGKSTLHEFAFGIRTFNPVVGQCRNPWDLTRIPGGSSGGSGVAVATGMAAMALGTDTGGSVRVPAALNGITGLRPTLGRVSNRGCMPVSPTHDTVGPMARSVEEVALLFAVIAGYDAEDHLSESRPLANFLPRIQDGISGLRVGRPRNHYFENLAQSVASAVEEAICTLARLGAEIVDIEVPGAADAHTWATTMIYSDACALHAERLEEGGDRWAPQTLERMRIGLKYSGADYARAMRQRESWCRQLEGVFRAVDVLVSPAAPTVAPLIEDDRSLFEATRAVTQNTYAGAFGRLPGLCVPCGVSREGLPIGLQVEAAPWNEALLLQVGWAFQSVTDWHKRLPELPVSAQRIP
jgi:aspartyl-tRNA(Asn)/glutamyl-tRNA(Gln) amidotransferase subunit A